jgi:ABC-type enterobactin transport system permease subunit
VSCCDGESADTYVGGQASDRLERFADCPQPRNLTRKQQIILSIGALIGGLLLCGFALTTTSGPLASNASVVLGLLFAVGGFIALILILKKKTEL